MRESSEYIVRESGYIWQLYVYLRSTLTFKNIVKIALLPKIGH